MKYTTLADVYAAQLKGEIDMDESFILVDGGEFSLYEHGEIIFECTYDEAMAFVSDILGLPYEHPLKCSKIRENTRRKRKSMQCFVATQETQGQRTNDFCFVPEGEILTFPVLTCTGEEPDGTCGCRRSLCGVKTHKATTTMKVVECAFKDVEQAILAFCREAGWSKMWSLVQEHEYVQSILKRINDTASLFPVGSIVELRGDEFVRRHS